MCVAAKHRVCLIDTLTSEARSAILKTVAVVSMKAPCIMDFHYMPCTSERTHQERVLVTVATFSNRM